MFGYIYRPVELTVPYPAIDNKQIKNKTVNNKTVNYKNNKTLKNRDRRDYIQQ